jgi:hypothetical protein
MRGAASLLHRKRISALQRAVDRLPASSRRAMLQGLGEDTIIAGAYSVGSTRCPGLAAYRRGARTGYSEFATAWDRYVRGRGVRRVRGDDVATLVAMLRASLATEPALELEGSGDLGGLGEQQDAEQVEHRTPDLVGVTDSGRE